MMNSIRHHWPEYLIEAAGLGIFMVSACIFTLILEHPASPIRQSIGDPFLRRMLIGVAMGLTAISIIYSPWGKQSGAHINPSVTLTFFRLGKVKSWDAFLHNCTIRWRAGGCAFLCSGNWKCNRRPFRQLCRYSSGMGGVGVAFLGELVISFVLMSVILIVSNTSSISRLTGLFAGILVATYITLEAPLSGMSMNPARTFGSALPAKLWTNVWICFIAPPLGMHLASEVYLLVRGAGSVLCAKLRHQNDKRCIHCGYPGVMKARS